MFSLPFIFNMTAEKKTEVVCCLHSVLLLPKKTLFSLLLHHSDDSGDNCVFVFAVDMMEVMDFQEEDLAVSR